MMIEGQNPFSELKERRGTSPPLHLSLFPLQGVPGRMEGRVCAPGRIYLVAQDNRLAGSQRDRQAIERDSQHQSGNATP